MRSNRILMAVAAIGAAITAATVASATNGARPASTTTIHVIEHAVTDATTDVGTPGDSAGDELTFHNKVFDAKDHGVVGSDQGHCIRVDPVGGSYECLYTTSLRGGQITVEGPFYDKRNSVLAITGGTGRYRTARGELRLLSRENGKKFDFLFTIVR
jgi:nucleotide-binding universal stress UspA family protein